MLRQRRQQVEQCNGELQAPPRHPFHDGLVQSRRPPSSRTRRNQYDAVGALACVRRRSDVTRRNGIEMSPYTTHYVQT